MVAIPLFLICMAYPIASCMHFCCRQNYTATRLLYKVLGNYLQNTLEDLCIAKGTEWAIGNSGNGNKK